jgi:hypothetical protein
MRPSFPIFVIFTGAVAVTLWRPHLNVTVQPPYPARLLPTAVCVSWYEVLRNHWQHNHWSIYRSAPFAPACLAAARVIFGLSTPLNGLALVDSSV